MLLLHIFEVKGTIEMNKISLVPFTFANRKRCVAFAFSKSITMVTLEKIALDYSYELKQKLHLLLYTS